jgi:hypothetical protein
MLFFNVNFIVCSSLFIIFIAYFFHYLLFVICYFDCCKFTISNFYLLKKFELHYLSIFASTNFYCFSFHYLFFVIFSFDFYKFNISNSFVVLYMNLIFFSLDLILKFTLQVLAML